MEINQKKAWEAVVAEMQRRVKAGGRGEATRLGELLGVAKSTISKWMSGELKGERVSVDTVLPIMKKLGIDPAPYFSMDAEFTEIPWVGAAALLGNDALGGGRLYGFYLSFRTQWLMGKGDPKHMVVINVSGGSMEPTIPDGAVVLIDESDRTRRDLVNGGIYLVCCGDGIFLKRLKVNRSGKVEALISDRDGSETPLDPDAFFAVRARALWFGREL